MVATMPDPAPTPFEESLGESLADFFDSRCSACEYAREIWTSLDKVEPIPLCDGCYNENQLACVKELLSPGIADVLDGIPPIVYVVHNNQRACPDFRRK